MSQDNAQNESYQLILAGPRDNTSELLDQLHSVIAKELKLATSAVKQLLASTPTTVAQAGDAEQLEGLYDRLKSAGARVFILRTTKVNAKPGARDSRQTISDSLSLDNYTPPSTAPDSLEYDSPNEQLSSLLSQLRKNALIDEWCEVKDVSLTEPAAPPTKSPAPSWQEIDSDSAESRPLSRKGN